MDESNPGFLGRGWAFPPRLNDHSGEAIMVAADTDIVESLRILMGTRPGERIMQPDYGCRLHDQVFETTDGATRAGIETAIRQAILFFEPRITLNEVSVALDDWLEGKMAITLDYTVDQTNNRANMVFPFYRDEGTLVADTPQLAF